MRLDRRNVGRLVLAAALVFAVLVPQLHLTFGVLLPGPLDSVGSMNLLAIMLVAAATAVTLDIVFGYAGLLSLGHAVYFGVGCYSVVMFTGLASLDFPMAVLLAMLTTLLLSVIGNACALNLSGFGYAMATLALVQLLAIFIERGYAGSGGEVGLTYSLGVLPDSFTGLVNTRHLYWLALGTLVVVYGLARWAVSTQAGSIWQAIRENPLRAQVLGVNVYAYRLAAAAFGSFLAGVCGIVYSIVMGGANPSIVELTYSLGLILMVVLGGRGVLWGAMLGGLLYTYLNLRLASVATATGMQDLPDVLRVPLTQPKFLLGVVFVLVILFVPGGLASAVTARWRTRRVPATAQSPEPTTQPTKRASDEGHEQPDTATGPEERVSTQP